MPSFSPIIQDPASRTRAESLWCPEPSSQPSHLPSTQLTELVASSFLPCFPEYSRVDPSPLGAHPSSQGDCLPCALRNHLRLVAWLPHSADLCPQPDQTGKGVSCRSWHLPSWVFRPAPHCSCPPASPQPCITVGQSASQGQQPSQLTSPAPPTAVAKVPESALAA